jgi:hypothetical protein
VQRRFRADGIDLKDAIKKNEETWIPIAAGKEKSPVGQYAKSSERHE